MTFSMDECRMRLHNVTGSQQSIQQLSRWLLHYRDICLLDVIECWKDVMNDYSKSINGNHKLLLLYVANDMLQEDLRLSKGRDRTVVNTFEYTIIQSIEQFVTKCHNDNHNNNNSKIIEQIMKLIQIWKQRCILSEDGMEALQLIMQTGRIGSNSIVQSQSPDGGGKNKTPKQTGNGTNRSKSITPSNKHKVYQHYEKKQSHEQSQEQEEEEENEQEHEQQSNPITYKNLKTIKEKIDFYSKLENDSNKLSTRELLDQIDEELLENVLAKGDGPESQTTNELVPLYENLTSSIMSSELLSDRLNKLRHYLDAFKHAGNEYQKMESNETLGDQKRESKILWSILQYNLFETDLDETTESVLQFRDRLNKEENDREEFTCALKKLHDYNIFSAPSDDVAKQNEDELKRVYMMYEKLLLHMDKVKKEKKEKEKQSKLMRRMSHGHDPYSVGQTPNHNRGYHNEMSMHRPSKWAPIQPPERSRVTSHYSSPSHSGNVTVPPNRVSYPHSSSPQFENPPHRPQLYEQAMHSPRNFDNHANYDNRQPNGNRWDMPPQRQGRPEVQVPPSQMYTPPPMQPMSSDWKGQSSQEGESYYGPSPSRNSQRRSNSRERNVNNMPRRDFW